MIQDGRYHIELRMSMSQKDKVRLLTELSRWRGAMGTATARAINKATTSTRTFIAKSVVQYIKVKYGAVLRRITVSKASKNRLYSKLFLSKRRLNIMDVTGTKQDKRPGGGVYFNTPNTKFVKGAFIARTGKVTKKGNKDIKGVFVRTGRLQKNAVIGKRGKPLKKREVIHMLKTGSPFIYWRNESDMAAKTEAFATEKLSTELNRQIDLFIKKKGIVTGKQVG